MSLTRKVSEKKTAPSNGSTYMPPSEILWNCHLNFENPWNSLTRRYVKLTWLMVLMMAILTIMTMEFMMQLGGEAWCAAPVFQSAFLALAKCISCIGKMQFLCWQNAFLVLAERNPSLWQNAIHRFGKKCTRLLN